MVRIAAILTLSAITAVGCGVTPDGQPQAAQLSLRPSRLLFDANGYPLAEGDLAHAAYLLVPATDPYAGLAEGTWFRVVGGQIRHTSGSTEMPQPVAEWLDKWRAEMAKPRRRRRYYDQAGVLLENADSVVNGYMFALEGGDAGSWGGLGRWYRIVDGKVDHAHPPRTIPEAVRKQWQNRAQPAD